jgi:hypothetical protein
MYLHYVKYKDLKIHLLYLTISVDFLKCVKKNWKLKNQRGILYSSISCSSISRNSRNIIY